jgi:hypothetical protein
MIDGEERRRRKNQCDTILRKEEKRYTKLIHHAYECTDNTHYNLRC